MEALWSFLLDRLDVERSILRVTRPLHASEVALRILAKGNWKIESFLWGGRFGRSLLCPGRAEKKTRGSWPPTGCLPVDRNQLGPDSWRDEKGVWYRTRRHAHTHTHGIKAVWTARAPALARTWPPARINFRYVGELRPFVRMKFTYSRWSLMRWKRWKRCDETVASQSYPWNFRSKAAEYETYENKKHTKYSGLTVVRCYCWSETIRNNWWL